MELLFSNGLYGVIIMSISSTKIGLTTKTTVQPNEQPSQPPIPPSSKIMLTAGGSIPGMMIAVQSPPANVNIGTMDAAVSPDQVVSVGVEDVQDVQV